MFFHRWLVISALFAATAFGQDITGDWSDVDRLAAGSPVILTLKSGRIFDGNFRSSDPDRLLIATKDTGVSAITKSEVQRVVSPRSDSVLNGVLLGIMAGTGAGALIGYSRRTFECR